MTQTNMRFTASDPAVAYLCATAAQAEREEAGVSPKSRGCISARGDLVPTNTNAVDARLCATVAGAAIRVELTRFAALF